MGNRRVRLLMDLVRYKLLVHVHCQRCKRIAVFDPNALYAFYGGNRELESLPFTCQKCGTRENLSIGFCDPPAPGEAPPRPKPLWSDR